MSERISQEKIVQIYNIEITFLDALEDSGLIHPEIENNIKYIIYDELPALERFANFHYDMDVNLPGLEIIHRLLNKIENLQQENRQLLNHHNFVIDKFIDM